MTDLGLCFEIVRELEWSDDATGAPTGMGLDNGHVYVDVRCPECGGLNPNRKDLRSEWMEEAFGHRSGCKIAVALGRSVVTRLGETGRLAL